MNTTDQRQNSDGSPALCSSELVRCVRISDQLLENLTVLRRLHGDKWSEIMADVGSSLQLCMKTTGERNPLAAAIPIAKAMSRENQNPMLLLAVATEIAQAPNHMINTGNCPDNSP